MRYRLLETMHAFSRDRLLRRKRVAKVRDRHLAHYLALAEQAAPELTGARQGEWLARLETEHENLRAALDWALEERSQEPGAGSQGKLSVIERSPEVPIVGTTKQPPPGQSEYPPPAPPAQGGRTIGAGPAMRLAVALGRFWLVHGWCSEGRESLALAIKRNSNPTSSKHGHALRWAGGLAAEQGDYDEARRLLDEGLTISRGTGDKHGIAAALNNLGLVAWNKGDYEEAKLLHQESLAIKRELGDKWGIAASLNNLGIMALDQGDFEEAKRLHQECIAICRELGHKHGIAFSLNNLGNLASNQGDYDGAKRLHQESIAIRRELGDKWGIAFSLNNLGEVALGQGDYEEAGRLQMESLTIFRELGDKYHIATSLEAFGYLAASEGNAERAARLFGAAGALRETIHAPLPPSERARHEKHVAIAKQALGEEAFNRAFAEGRTMTPDEAVTFALES